MKRLEMRRLEALEQKVPARRLGEHEAEFDAWHCMVDGEPQIMTTLDMAYAECAEGKKVERLAYAGKVVRECGTREDLDRAFEEMEAEFNGPEGKAQRQAEYERMQRIGEIRRRNYECGRPMNFGIEDVE